MGSAVFHIHCAAPDFTSCARLCEGRAGEDEARSSHDAGGAAAEQNLCVGGTQPMTGCCSKGTEKFLCEVKIVFGQRLVVSAF